MTCEQIEPGQWRLSFAEPEARFIIHVLAQLGRLYQQDAAQMSPALRAYWQGNIGQGKGPELQESQEVLSEARAELRSERLSLVENWIQEFEIAEEREPWLVEVTGAERDEFVAMLNDRRMMLAIELGITERDMEMEPGDIADEARRQSIFEIDVLGHFILITLGPQIHRP
jgi:hypothetical protein